MSDAGNTQPTTPNETINAPTNQTTGMTMDQVMNLWIQAGGNAQAAQMAAAVADASSGGNPSAQTTNPDGTTSVGLWLIPSNGVPPGSTDPLANARAAVQMSQNGTDWSQWCVTWSDNNCGLNGGSYLGSGSNALGSLASGEGTYNVIGSQVSGNGTGASSAPSTPVTSASTSGSSYLRWIIIIGIIVAVFVMVRRRTGESNGAGEESQSRSQRGWSPEEEAGLSDSSKTDKQLSAETGRSIRAIRVRRNQLKSQ